MSGKAAGAGFIAVVVLLVAIGALVATALSSPFPAIGGALGYELALSCGGAIVIIVALQIGVVLSKSCGTDSGSA